jgi:Tol biopolymer transport system component
MAEPIHDRRPPKRPLANESWRSRTGRRRILVIALVALIIGGRGAVWLLFERGGDDPTWSDSAPKWSPDGKRIGFESNRTDPKRHFDAIYAMNADGSRLHELTKTGTDAEHPSWSPDGKSIVYVQGQLNYDQYDEAVYGGGGRIMVMRADGSGKRELAFSGSTDAVSWSPDGRWIAYEAHSHEPDARPAVYIVHPDGSGLRLIATDAFSPSWSPDGKLLAFSDGDGSLFSDHTPVVLRVASGKKLDLVLGPSGLSDSIAWSPDGSKIAFIAGEVPVAAPAPNASVYVAVANADGNFVATSPPDHLDAVTEIHGLAWLPGSRHRIIYHSFKGAFLVSAASGHDRLLNADGCCAAEPSPDGKKILYVETTGSSTTAITVGPSTGGSAQRLTQTTG